MRLSETGLSPARRTQLPDLAGYNGPQRNKPFINKTMLSIGLVVLLVGVAAGAIAIGKQMITRAASVTNTDCTLILPRNPLSARGLATPFQLVATNPGDGPCNESNPDQSAFVEGAVLDQATGQISVYDPLVIDQGTKPAAAPVVPKLPTNAIVALWFGSNSDVLRLRGGQGANCVNGLNRSVFGQYSYCNAPLFFLAANRLIRAGKITVPALGMGTDGLPCPTVRDFSVVDQDQSDNVTTVYLVTQDGRTAQNTPANKTALPDAEVQKNGSDNGLLVGPLDTALGCTPWKAPDLASPGQMLTALPLNELQAAADQQAPVALVPLGDPMTLANGKENLTKTNLYRLGVNQVPARTTQQADTKAYCQNLLQIAPQRLQTDQALLTTVGSPDAGAANNLFTFLAQRFNASFGPDNLNCSGLLNMQSPITTQTDGNGVTISATINLNGGDNGGGNNGGGNNGGGDNGGGNNGGGNNNGGGDNGGGNNGGGNNGGGDNGGGNGQTNSPTCIINGVAVDNCSGTTTITMTCTVTYDANTNQIIINCPGK
jgi:hypothetical protein